MKKRALIIMLLVLISLSSFSCKNNPDDTQSSSQTSKAGTDSAPLSLSDILPDEDFDNSTFTILTRKTYSYEFIFNEENLSEPINNGVYKRNRAVEERYKIKIETIEQPGAWGAEATAFNERIRKSISAGDNEFQLIAGYAAVTPALISEDMFYNWLDLEYIDVSRDWWSKGFADEFTINDKLYMMTGDISLVMWEMMHSIFFNKKLAQDYGIGDMYKLVDEGKWTFDKMADLCKDTYKDINNNNSRDKEDQFGYISRHTTQVDIWKEAFGIRVTSKGADGYPYLTVNNEKTASAIEKVRGLLFGNPDTYYEKTSSTIDMDKIFNEGRALFYPIHLGKAQGLREMTEDFGILPMPKYDESQEGYYTTTVDEVTVFLIPHNVLDPDMTSIIVEALCAYSHEQLIPFFYDVALKGMASRDEESGRMMDIIRDGLSFNFGVIYSSSANWLGHIIFRDVVTNKDMNFASTYSSNENSFKSGLDKVLAIYK